MLVFYNEVVANWYGKEACPHLEGIDMLSKLQNGTILFIEHNIYYVNNKRALLVWKERELCQS